ncbi:hypothetical protein ACIHCQ_26490 [Streptomyces sp. NPDC052236]|uniref:hypothetical protein n=1 Tax=Streptomyces sp. NPDC052236 TaxID=3365686 RepID=UPI0037CD0696
MKLRPRIRPRVRHRAAAVLASGVLLLTGCGIQSTDVVAAGEPATITTVGGRDRTLLYFVSPAGDLMPVVRSPGTGSVGKTYALLFSGPDETDSAAGLTTELPAGGSWGKAGGGGGVKVGELTNSVEFTVGMAVGGLSATARDQLLCTLAYAVVAEGDAEVTVTGSDGSFGPGRCPLAA